MTIRGQYLIPIIAVVVSLGVIGCTSTGELTEEQQAEIVDGANTIILTRTDPGETIGRTSVALDLYTDAVRVLENAGFAMSSTDADQMIFQTEPREVEPGLALQISGEVRQDGVGAKLITAAMHASDEYAMPSEWEDVVWQNGGEEGPFARTYLAVASIPHDEIGTAVE